MSQRLLNPTSALFTRSVRLDPGAYVLLLGSDDPALARWAVESVGPAGQVTALHTSYRALSLLARVPSLRVGDTVYPDPDIHGSADAALLAVPKGREHTRAYLWTAAQALRPGGSMYVAGPNSGGVKTAITDTAALFGAAPVLGYKNSCRIALAQRPGTLSAPPDWCDPPPWEPQTRRFARPEGDYSIITQPGVFSWDHLDDGTALLLDHLGVEPGKDVLDIGCGYGIIGLAAARAGAWVVLVDDDLLAVRCTRASVAANGLADRCEVLPGDATSTIVERHFDLVLSNPPFHKGIDTTTGITARFVRGACDVLRPGGRLRIVANRFLPYDGVLRAAFGNVTTIAATGRYVVLESVRA
jgi:16S rRNA (guanine1207-N2)-methyltransferase